MVSNGFRLSCDLLTGQESFPDLVLDPEVNTRKYLKIHKDLKESALHADFRSKGSALPSGLTRPLQSPGPGFSAWLFGTPGRSGCDALRRTRGDG